MSILLNKMNIMNDSYSVECHFLTEDSRYCCLFEQDLARHMVNLAHNWTENEFSVRVFRPQCSFDVTAQI